jgi:hypothetical protein
LYYRSNYLFDIGSRHLHFEESFININNINDYDIIKNNDYLFIITNDKVLYIYNIINQNQYSKYLQKSLTNFSSPKLFLGKNNDSVYILDVGNNNKIYKVELENEININPISTSLTLVYRHLSSNLESQQYALAIGDNKVYITDNYGQNWKEMK